MEKGIDWRDLKNPVFDPNLVENSFKEILKIHSPSIMDSRVMCSLCLNQQTAQEV